VIASVSRWLAAGAIAAAIAPSSALSPAAVTAKYFASIRTDPPRLRAFLTEMPKGGDLHNHLSGAIYAESYAAFAAGDGLCVNVTTMALVAPPCVAALGLPPASSAFQDPAMLNAFIDGVSMRHWPRDRNGHDQFFNAFTKFGAASGPPGDRFAARIGDMIAEVSARAAAERVSYLELMLTPDGGAAAAAGAAAEWNPDFGKLRTALLAGDFAAVVVAAARQNLERAEARRRELLNCGDDRSAEASRNGGSPRGCDVTIRYLAQVSRSASPQVVFAQMLAGFLEASAGDLPIVGLNMVAPEDNPVALRDFRLHMSMLEYLRREYPSVRISLHAGELTGGLVPPESLRFHIRASVETAGAARIGHGVDVMYEDGAPGLLREMAAKHVLVEIALTSNDFILGVAGKHHPLSAYLRAGVPVAIVTDDPGVARSSETDEFEKAVEDQGLDYSTLKQLARNSIEYAFVDQATKARLRRDLEAAFTTFEKLQTSRLRDRGVRGRTPMDTSGQS
jgi:adenosine deaminase